jgi:hypothetical protein
MPCARRRRRGPSRSERFGSWSTLRASLLRMVHAAMSAVLAPEFDLTPYANAPPDLVARARQLGSLVPKVTPGAVGLSDFRKQLAKLFRRLRVGDPRPRPPHLASAALTVSGRCGRRAPRR